MLGRRSRNQEMRYLLAMAFDWAGAADVTINVPKDNEVRSVIWCEEEIAGLIEDRAALFQRSLGKEIVRLMAYAIQESTDRDIAMLQELMLLQGSPVHAPLQIDTSEFQSASPGSPQLAA
jgi:hypothetical protein